MNSKLAKVALAAVAPLMLVTVVTLSGGVASAKKAPAATINCTGLTATVTWNPALVPGAATSKTDQSTISDATVTGCTPSSGPAVTAASSVTAKASKSKNGNSCSSLETTGGKKTKYTFTIGWNNGGGTSTVKFSGSQTNTSPPGFTLSPGKGKGSYPTKTASVTANLNSSSSAALAACIAGSGGPVSSVTVSSGSASL
ncbi:MAG: hypothetical protein ACRDY1_11600 [Acidimicrobiales bacterium]